MVYPNYDFARNLKMQWRFEIYLKRLPTRKPKQIVSSVIAYIYQAPHEPQIFDKFAHSISNSNPSKDVFWEGVEGGWDPLTHPGCKPDPIVHDTAATARLLRMVRMTVGNTFSLRHLRHNKRRP